MKTLRFPLYLALAAATVLSACDKKDKDKGGDPSPKTKTDMLTGKDWIMTAETVSPALRRQDGTLVTDVFATMDDCDKDDLLRFEKPSAYTLSEGASKCDPTHPQSYTGTWSFNSTETILSTTLQGQPNSSYNIVEMNDNTMKLSGVQTYNNVDYTFTFVFSKH
ncbi:lipocalin family protein [Hymenobacter sp. CRA2]|uniref:lipocalin family protein n=1 Tax=Hymenobacter sp. CRA2 TaxID=1955620 RepID=UPI0009C79883|nr:lipocalin family protein [Hymenobacter sp. CRA2]OON70731.1 hypothetical protein B0919_01575 [Hymenobacter sp. CRA2]